MIELVRALIINKYRSLLSDDGYEILYLGKNINNDTIIGSIMDEDDEIGEIRYIHSIISSDTKDRFLKREITYRQVMNEASEMFIIKTNYTNTNLDIRLSSLDSIDTMCLPTEDSYLPSFTNINNA